MIKNLEADKSSYENYLNKNYFDHPENALFPKLSYAHIFLFNKLLKNISMITVCLRTIFFCKTLCLRP